MGTTASSSEEQAAISLSQLTVGKRSLFSEKRLNKFEKAVKFSRKSAPEQIEVLAAEFHVLWGATIGSLLDGLTQNKDGSITIPANKVKELEGLMYSAYETTPDAMKEVGRDQARVLLRLMSQ